MSSSIFQFVKDKPTQTLSPASKEIQEPSELTPDQESIFSFAKGEQPDTDQLPQGAQLPPSAEDQAEIDEILSEEGIERRYEKAWANAAWPARATAPSTKARRNCA